MSLWWWKKYRKQQCEATQALKSLKVIWESFLQIADRPDCSAAYVKLNDVSSFHMAPYINKVFNSNLEHDYMERLRRVRGER